MKKRFFAFILLLIVGAMVCSCTATPVPPTTAPTASTTPEPSPSPTPAPIPDADEILEQVFSINVLNYIPADIYVRDDKAKAYDIIVSDPEKTYALEQQYLDWFANATAQEDDPRRHESSIRHETPSWKLLSVLAYNYSENEAGLRQALESVYSYDIDISRVYPDDPALALYTLDMKASPQNPRDLFYSLPSDNNVTPLSNMLSYAYLATIFDNEMQTRNGIEDRVLESLLFPIAQPEAYYFVDCWYDARDGGARRHTGTDINAPEGTDLLACVDGTILDAGGGPGTGNYVVLLGKDDTQYHYYHMLELPDVQIGQEVLTGDVVGHVGNTGNSTANHLHFTIITDDGYYLNPYPYLAESQTQTIASEKEQEQPSE